MKKLLLFMMMLAAVSAYSQDNAVKLKLMGLGYGNYTVSYERALSEKNSINASFALLSPDGAIKNYLPNWYYEWDGSGSGPFDKNGKGITEDAPWIGEFYSGYGFSVDYRMYGKQALKGFYYGPYVKYMSLDFRLEDEIRGPYYTIESNISGFGAGFEIGNQWLIIDRIVLDLYFGLGAQLFSATGKYVQDPVPAAGSFDYSDIIPDVIDAYAKIPYIDKRLETTVESDALLLHIPLPLPDLRGGFSIGFAF